MDVHPTKNVSIGIDPYPIVVAQLLLENQTREIRRVGVQQREETERNQSRLITRVE